MHKCRKAHLESVEGSNNETTQVSNTVEQNDENSPSSILNTEADDYFVELSEYKYNEYGYIKYSYKEDSSQIAFSHILFIPQFEEINEGVAILWEDSGDIVIYVRVGGQFGKISTFRVNLDTEKITIEPEISEDTESSLTELNDSDMKEIATIFYELFTVCQEIYPAAQS